MTDGGPAFPYDVTAKDRELARRLDEKRITHWTSYPSIWREELAKAIAAARAEGYVNGLDDGREDSDVWHEVCGVLGVNHIGVSLIELVKMIGRIRAEARVSADARDLGHGEGRAAERLAMLKFLCGEPEEEQADD